MKRPELTSDELDWEKFKEKGKELGYIDLDDYIKKYNDRTQYMIAFYKDGGIEIDDYIVIYVASYDKMLLVLKGFE